MMALRTALVLSLPLFGLGLATRAQASHAPTAWSNLWQTPDQQGQALLDAGDPADAAGRFQDPRRRGYAELQAGRYQDAAKLLEPLTDAQSEYNRGNALAKAGRLQPALAAYDAALKQSPTDKDIVHNRDLVARALKQQQPQSGRNGGQNGQKSGQKSDQKSGQSGASGQQQSGSRQQKGSGSQQSGAQGQKSAGGAPNDSRAGGSGADRSGSGSQQSSQGNGDNSKEAPGQAQRDAEEAAALARRQQQGKQGAAGQPPGAARQGVAKSGEKEGNSNGQSLGSGMQTPRQKPESERQLALDQWLRQIPDSPAGLLQRKFLIEHMMKQQEGSDPQGGNP